MSWREIRWTEDSEAHIARHDVTPDEVEQVLNTRPRLVEQGRGDTEEIYGTTDAGRYLFVLASEAEDGRSFIVSARPMNSSEQRAFKHRAR